MNTGDWIQLGLLLLIMLIAVLVIYSWMNWQPIVSIVITLSVLFAARLVLRRIQL
jgi:hypothetical protein